MVPTPDLTGSLRGSIFWDNNSENAVFQLIEPCHIFRQLNFPRKVTWFFSTTPSLIHVPNSCSFPSGCDDDSSFFPTFCFLLPSHSHLLFLLLCPPCHNLFIINIFSQCIRITSYKKFNQNNNKDREIWVMVICTWIVDFEDVGVWGFKPAHQNRYTVPWPINQRAKKESLERIIKEE